MTAPVPDSDPRHAKRRILIRFWREWARPYRRSLAVALVLMGIVAGTTSAYPFLVERILGALRNAGQGSAEQGWLLGVVLAVIVVRSAAMYLQTVVAQRAALRMVFDLQTSLFAHLQRADLRRLQREPTGTLVSRFTNDVGLLRVAFAQALGAAVRDGLTVLFLVAAIFAIDWKLSLACCAVYPFVAVPIQAIGKRLRELSRAAQANVGELTTLLVESLSGARLVKTYRMEEHEERRLGAAFTRYELLNRDQVRSRARLDPLLELFGGLAVAAMMALGWWRISEGELTVESMIAFIMALLLASQPVRSLGSVAGTLNEAAAAAERLYQVIDERPSIVDAPAARPLKRGGGRIEFDRVTLRYGATPALHEVSFEVPAGGTVALVGRSGSGKSSALALVPRLYDVTSGAVRIDGQDVRDVTLASLRDAVAVVSQDVLLFDDTIEANIGFGRPGASRAEVEAAARAAAAHEFIVALPGGYATRVGERGAVLSGGERQRVALARALLKGAPVLLLDEATSALDAESERLVQEALEAASRGRTLLVVAHRLATVRAVDRIIVLDQGRVVEEGTHVELVARGGAYAEFARLQFREGV